MFAEIQTQDVLALALDQAIEYAFVQDADLLHVGGGSTTCHF